MTKAASLAILSAAAAVAPAAADGTVFEAAAMVYVFQIGAPILFSSEPLTSSVFCPAE